jgi:diguanylate cyclase (GGDEF)-like protein
MHLQHQTDQGDWTLMSLAAFHHLLQMRGEPWLLCIFLMTLLSAYTALQFSWQIVAESGAERRLWLMSACAIAGYGRVAVQLALVRLLQGSPGSRYDIRWIAAGYALTLAGRYVVFKSVTEAPRLRRLVPVAVFECVTIIATQLALFRAAHLVYNIIAADTVVLFLVCTLTCVFGVTVAVGLLHGKAKTKAWYRSRPAYVAGVLIYYVLLRLAAGALGQLNIHTDLPYTTPRTVFELYWIPISFLIVFAPVLLGAGLVAIFLQGRGRRWGRDLLLREEQQRVESALSEQRVTRLQNEALVEEVRERKKMEAELLQAAFHDAVTGLNNRAYLTKRLKEKLGSRGRHDASALLYIDIDNFKSVNDMLGHSQGDLLLKAMGKRLRNCLHEVDTLVCMGGDEYVVLLDRMSTPEHGVRFAQHVLNVIEQPIEIAGTTFPLSASIGLCILEASYSSAEAVLRDADLAMYVAKRGGGAQVAVYQQAMLADAMAAQNAKAELATAIARNEFVLFYQPLVNLRDGSPYGVEALIRWMHPDKGLISPGLFIPLADQTGRIVDIGSWVLRQACMEYSRLRDAAAKHLLLSLNVSTRQLELPSFLAELKGVLEETKMPPRRLQLEITESSMLGDPTRTGMLFEEIRRLGVKIAFDDFGTGYSSLSYLQRYPIDTLKIDQSFVRALKDGPVNLDIVGLILNLARVTGMGVCAEGIETKEEAAKLLSIGCTAAQGYLYSRPMAFDKCLEYLSQSVDDLVQTGT